MEAHGQAKIRGKIEGGPRAAPTLSLVKKDAGPKPPREIQVALYSKIWHTYLLICLYAPNPSIERTALESLVQPLDIHLHGHFDHQLTGMAVNLLKGQAANHSSTSCFAYSDQIDGYCKPLVKKVFGCQKRVSQ